jgi:hypothetical protein
VDPQPKILWITIGGALGALLVAISSVALWRDTNSDPRPSSPTITSFPSKSVPFNQNDDSPVTGNFPTPSQGSIPGDQVSSPPVPAMSPDTTHNKIVSVLNARMREESKKLFAEAFQQLGLSTNVQDKVIDILTEGEKQLEQQAFEAAKSGTIPKPPSLEEIQTQRLQQDQQLRALLGDSRFAQFSQYRATIPDRLIINGMNQEGANLNESQSQQLLQVLTQARQQVIGQSGVTSSLNSMSRDQVIATIQQQQLLLQQTVNNRVQNILNAEQTAILQRALSRPGVGPQSP